VPGLKEATRQIDGVSVAQVRDFAGRMTARGDAAMALYGPVEAAPGLGSLKERLAA
jgi:hypothetical protein